MINFEDLKFMSIGGNCTNIYLLGWKNRIRGPIDNVLIEKVGAIQLLFENKYYNYVKNKPVKLTPKAPQGNDPLFSSTYFAGMTMPHNNPKTEKYLEELKIRLETFNQFYTELKQPKSHNFFIFVLNNRTNYYNQKMLRGTLLVDILNFLKSLNLLDKVIFIGTTEDISLKLNWSYYNYSLNKDDLKKLQANYNLNYFEVNNLNLETLDGKLAAAKQFKDAFMNWANRKDLY